MPRQFSPADRETVREHLEGNGNVFDVSECGDGLYVVYAHNKSPVHLYTTLMEGAGWYVASYDRQEEGGDKAVFMPVTEVP